MTWYELTLRRYDTNPATDEQVGRTMSHLESDDEGVIASTMRKIADRLDPPYLGRTPSEGLAIITAAERREAADRRFREKLAGDTGPGRRPVSALDAVALNAYTCRGDACSEGHTYRAGCLLAGTPPRDSNGLPNYAHDAGPEACPPPRIATPAQIDAMVCPDCIGDRHTHQPGRCALPPPWNGVSVLDTRRGTRAGACDQPGHGTTGCDCLPVVVDDPGDRMDVPDAVLSASAAEAVARVAQDEAELMARMRQGGHGRGKGPLMSTRRPGSRITPDGCGPEHTFTGSCAYAAPERINPNA